MAFNATRQKLEQWNASVQAQHLEEVAHEIVLAKRNIILPPNPTPFDRIAHERLGVENLLNRKRAELQASLNKAAEFFGDSPQGKTFKDFYNVFQTRYRHLPSQERARAFSDWEASYKASVWAQTQAKAIELIVAEFNVREATYQHAFNVRVQEQAQRAAVEQMAREAAQRAAAEQAARETAQRAAAEQAAREAAQQAAAEQAAREAAQQAAAEQAAREAAQQAAAEQAAREAAQQAAAEQAAREAAQQAAAEQAAREAAQQAAAEQAAREAAQHSQAQADEIPMRLEDGSVNPAWVEYLDRLDRQIFPRSGKRPHVLLNIPAVRREAIEAAIIVARAAQSIGRVADDVGADVARQFSRAMQSLRGAIQDYDGFFSGSTPASEVLPQDAASSLPQIADQQGTVDIPGWAYMLGDAVASLELSPTQVTAAAPEQVIVLEAAQIIAAAQVPVRSATFDQTRKTWRVPIPASTGAELIWTPIAAPQDSSTTLPAEAPSEMPYIGIPLIPVEQMTLPLPVVPPGVHGLITVFPADSGLPPLFTVYSSPYPGADVEGVYSGRLYNPDKAGGPTLELKWQDVAITQAGIDQVRLHTGRMDYAASNDVMIKRLENILAGEVEVTDIDKRYYTHEIRELERYRALGLSDGKVPDAVKGEVWNNAHTATLEDFQLKDDSGLLYTQEAQLADAEYEMRDYERMLKEGL